jgi:hypothetical protein
VSASRNRDELCIIPTFYGKFFSSIDSHVEEKSVLIPIFGEIALSSPHYSTADPDKFWFPSTPNPVKQAGVEPLLLHDDQGQKSRSNQSFLTNFVASPQRLLRLTSPIKFISYSHRFHPTLFSRFRYIYQHIQQEHTRQAKTSGERKRPPTSQTKER